MRKRNRTITIRCTDDEYKQIHNKAQRHKLSLSDFVLRSAMDKKIIHVAPQSLLWIWVGNSPISVLAAKAGVFVRDSKTTDTETY